MATSSDPQAPLVYRRLVLPLGAILLATLLIISFLMIENKPTLVEMSVTVRRAAFEVLPPIQAGEDAGDPKAASLPLARRTSLFPPSLPVKAMEIRDVDCVETTLDGVGPVGLQTEPGGSIDVRMESPFHPVLVLNEPTSLDVEIAGRDKVTIWLEQSRPSHPAASPRPVMAGSGQVELCAEPAAQDWGWTGSLTTGVAMALRLREVRGAEPTGAALDGSLTAETAEVPWNAARFRIAGGRRDSQIRLALPHPARPSTVLRVLNPETGEVSSSTNLPFVLSEPRSLPWRDRLVLLDPEPGGESSVPLLRSDLKIRGLELTRRVQLEAQSFVLEGEVRFPAGEKAPIKLDPGTFVSLSADPRKPLTLRSLELSGESLRILLWGEPTDLKIGPTPELRAERLPSYFEWLCTHRLGGLVYGTLAYVSALSLGIFKLLGWVKG